MKKIKNASGFTIIELLVVIAIIGILAAVILSSLNDARFSGLNAKVLTEMDSITKVAATEELETFSYDTVCNSPQSTPIAALILSINTVTGGGAICNSSITEYAVSAPILNTTDHWCVDSTGAKQEIATPLVSGVDFDCTP